MSFEDDIHQLKKMAELLGHANALAAQAERRAKNDQDQERESFWNDLKWATFNALGTVVETLNTVGK